MFFGRAGGSATGLPKGAHRRLGADADGKSQAARLCQIVGLLIDKRTELGLYLGCHVFPVFFAAVG